MRYVLLTNPEKIVTQDMPFGKTEMRVVESAGRDIERYPIEEPRLDAEGNLIETAKPPFYEKTDRSLEWSIKKGQTLEIPEYVAKVLKKRYDFLEIHEITAPAKAEDTGTTNDKTPVQSEEEAAKMEMAKPAEGQSNCKYCGASFGSTRGLALHIAHKHPEKIV